MKLRILRHLIFWLAYTSLYAWLSASFPAKSDLAFAFPMRFFRFWLTECMSLPIKWVAVYGLLYWGFPRYFLNRKIGVGLLITVLVLVMLLLSSRLVTYYLAYPFLYDEYPGYELISAKRLLYSFLDIFSAVGAFATVKLFLSKLEMKKREEALQKEKLIAELQFLKAQTNPHFLFNTLNNIYGLARRKSDDTEKAVIKLSEIMRFMLYECDKPRIDLSLESAAVQNYVDLEKLRYGEELTVRFHNRVNGRHVYVAPLLLLPLVENAFKHGASESRHDRYIHIDLGLEKEELYYRVENSFEGSNSNLTSGIGLKNIRRQLELIYPNRHMLTIENKEKRFLVELRIQNIV